jgi:hypothetical protein
MGLADRPWIVLAVLYSDVTTAIIFGNAELRGLGRVHEIEGSRQADGTKVGRGAARVVDGGIAFVGRQLATACGDGAPGRRLGFCRQLP